MSLGHNPTSVNSNGLILNLDAGNPTSLSNTSKNLYTSATENFTSGVWALNQGTITANQAMAPDGSMTANLFTALGQFPLIRWNATFSTPAVQTKYTFSTHVKYINQRYCNLINENGWLGGSNFDLIAGTVSDTASCTITALANGWYRLTATFTVPAGAGPFNLIPQFRIGNYDGTNYNGSQIYIWGMQLEVDPTASAYYSTSSNRLTTTWTDLSLTTRSPDLTQVEVLVVAGGGGTGALWQGGGGGGGGIVYRPSFTVAPGTSYTATVGLGGNGSGVSQELQSDGGNSVFGSLTALGGGKGSSENVTRNNGGSGGGSSHATTSDASNATQPGSASGGFGNNGGGWDPALPNSYPFSAGGGGGAGAPGALVKETDANPGKGGDGLPFNITGSTVFYGGGGAGSNRNGVSAPGGLGGGGATGQSGTPNTGGGGGAGTQAPALEMQKVGGAGGSGIVVVRYPAPVRATGGTITIVDNQVIHTFTSGTTSFVVDNSAIQLVASPFYTTQGGGSLLLNGTDSYIRAGGNLGVLSAYTIIFWARRDAENRMPIGTTDDAFYWYGDNSWKYVHGGVTGEYYYPKPTTIALNTWGQYCVVYNGSNVTIYRQGVFQGQQSTTGTANFTKGILIGYRGTGGATFMWYGLISSVQMYSRALSASEVLNNYNSLRGRYGL